VAAIVPFLRGFLRTLWESVVAGSCWEVDLVELRVTRAWVLVRGLARGERRLDFGATGVGWRLDLDLERRLVVTWVHWVSCCTLRAGAHVVAIGTLRAGAYCVAFCTLRAGAGCVLGCLV
jgi:hypothetical protein